jgi:hypothetical protein
LEPYPKPTGRALKGKQASSFASWTLATNPQATHIAKIQLPFFYLKEHMLVCLFVFPQSSNAQ